MNAFERWSAEAIHAFKEGDRNDHPNAIQDMRMTISYESAADAPLARDIVEGVTIQLSPVARSLLRPEQRRGEYLQVLVDKGLVDDALCFLAYALPRRHAVWWGCLCLSDLFDLASVGEGEVNSLQSSIAWVIEPTEERRDAASRWGARLPPSSPFRWLARAAGFLDLPLPQAADHLPQNFPAKGVYSAIALALAEEAVRNGEQQAPAARVLSLGWEVSRGKNIWPKAPPKA